MAKALFIKPEDIIKNTFVDGSLDRDKLTQFIYLSQQKDVRGYLGEDLYDKIATDIVAGNLAGVYLALNTDYIQPFLIHSSMSMFLPFAGYTLGNGGVFKHQGASEQVVEQTEVDALSEQHRIHSEYFGELLVKHLCENDSNFPEYSTNTGDEIVPNKDINPTNWVL